MSTLSHIAVSFTVDGYHQWPDAPPRRQYLADRHRHRFGIRVEVPVAHDDRDIEFHDLHDTTRSLLHEHWGREPIEFGAWSCERIAHWIASITLHTHPTLEWCTATVDEDGQVSATATITEKDTIT